MENDTFLPVKEDFSRLSEKYNKENTPNIYKENQSIIKTFSLPRPSLNIKKPFAEVLLNRQTIRSYNMDNFISLEDLSEILYFVWGAQACWLPRGIGTALIKTSPSGGSRHSIEVYLAILNVESLPPGYYYYSVKHHCLKLLEESETIREEVIHFCGEQPHTGLPSVVFFYSSVLERVMWKYPTPKSYRVILMDLGHLSQTLYLVSSAMDLGCFFTAALREESLEKKLGIDNSQEVILAASGIGVLTPEIKQLNSSGRFGHLL